jgi:hypothetical protein
MTESTTTDPIVSMFSDEILLFSAGIQPQSYIFGTSTSEMYPKKYPESYTLLNQPLQLSKVPFDKFTKIYIPPNTRLDIVYREYVYIPASGGGDDTGNNIWTWVNPTPFKQQQKEMMLREPILTEVEKTVALVGEYSAKVWTGELYKRPDNIYSEPYPGEFNFITSIIFQTILPVGDFIRERLCMPIHPKAPFTEDGDKRYEVCDSLITDHCANNWEDTRCSCFTEQQILDSTYGNVTLQQILLTLDDEKRSVDDVSWQNDGTTTEWAENIIRFDNVDYSIHYMTKTEQVDDDDIITGDDDTFDMILDNITTITIPHMQSIERSGNYSILFTRDKLGNFDNFSIRFSTNITGTIKEVLHGSESNSSQLQIPVNMSAVCLGNVCAQRTSYKTLDMQREQCSQQCIQIVAISGSDMIAHGQQTLLCGNEIYNLESSQVVTETAAPSLDERVETVFTTPNIILICIGIAFAILAIAWTIIRFR